MSYAPGTMAAGPPILGFLCGWRMWGTVGMCEAGLRREERIGRAILGYSPVGWLTMEGKVGGTGLLDRLVWLPGAVEALRAGAGAATRESYLGWSEEVRG